MTALAHFLGSPVMKPVGWTLVHFLWQGAVVAAMLVGVLLLMRRSSAYARYLAACIAFLIMASSPVITLAFLMGRQDPVITVHSSHTDAAPIPLEGRTAPTGARSAPLPRTHPRPAKESGACLRLTGVASHASQLLEPALPGLVATWLIGIVLLCLRLLGGWVVVRRLARRETRPVQAWLRERAEELARRLGIRHSVNLLESVLVEVPTVIGCLRAVILVPASALTGLSPQQLEALLAHELAHVRRHDYLVNLIQTAVETLLFYHPAVWWVSHQIRVERENCCDDLAVAAVGDRLTYARALAALEELRAVPVRLALAGSGGDLLARIRRILGLPSGPPEPAPAGLMGTVLLPLLLAAAAALHAPTGDRFHWDGRRSLGKAPMVTAGMVETPADPPVCPGSPALPRGAARIQAAGEDAGRRAEPGLYTRLNPAAAGWRTATGRVTDSTGRLGSRIGDRGDRRLPEGQAAAVDPIRSPLAAASGAVRSQRRRGAEHVRRSGGRGALARPEQGAPTFGGYPARHSASIREVTLSLRSAAAHAQAGRSRIWSADRPPVEARPGAGRPRSMDLTGVNLAGADLRGLDLTGVSFRGARLPAVDLSGRDLRGKDLSRAVLSSANLTGARLAGADLTDANLSGADLTKADLSHCQMAGANCSGASLHGTHLAGVDLSQVKLDGADLKGLDLREIRLAGARLAGADLVGWDLSRQDLSRANLSGVNLTGARLAGAVLTDANLSGADLTDTDLSHARMWGANCSGTRLHGTRLVGVDLAHVNLSGADLYGLQLTGVDLARVPRPAVSLAGRNLTVGFPRKE